MTDNAFQPPTPYCKGLWFDGQYFWSAESRDTVGQIFRFDHQGNVVDSWQEPAFSGYAACKVWGPMSAQGMVINDELTIQWIPHPDAASYWMYGAVNEPHFPIEISSPYANRVAVLRPNSNVWSSPAGIGTPSANWTYTVVAVDNEDQAIMVSNRIGEFDYETAIPDR